MAAASRTAFMHKFAAALLSNDEAAVSPVSAYLCLSLVLVGATKETGTHRQMCELFCIDPENEDEFLLACADVLAELQTQHQNVEFLTANSLWGNGIKQAYLDVCSKKLRADARPLSNSAAINAWVADKTKNNIREILTSDPEGPLVCTNATYFKGQWTYKFDPANTQVVPFYTNFPESIPAADCHMMEITTKLLYTEHADTKVVQLPYGPATETNSFVAYVLLPGRQGCLKSTLQHFVQDAKVWGEVVNSLSFEDVNLRVPKFRIETNKSVRDALKGLGMSDAFGPSASFTRISDDPGVFLEDVLTAVMIEVDEAGTEAAAATAAVFATRSISFHKKEPIDMKCNRPFVFLLVHKETNALLFAATVKNPGAVKPKKEACKPDESCKPDEE